MTEAAPTLKVPLALRGLFFVTLCALGLLVMFRVLNQASVFPPVPKDAGLAPRLAKTTPNVREVRFAAEDGSWVGISGRARVVVYNTSVITDPARKQRIRAAAEKEEREFYGGKAPQEWLDALAPLGTDPNKPFLEEAPVLIAIFAQKYGHRTDGSRISHYYVPESVGIASGFLIAALHHAGLATLTHTPSPMGFLNEICDRPPSEKPVILLVVGYPKPGCLVPVHGGIKKPLDQIAQWLDAEGPAVRA